MEMKNDLKQGVKHMIQYSRLKKENDALPASLSRSKL